MDESSQRKPLGIERFSMVSLFSWPCSQRFWTVSDFWKDNKNLWSLAAVWQKAFPSTSRSHLLTIFSPLIFLYHYVSLTALLYSTLGLSFCTYFIPWHSKQSSFIICQSIYSTVYGTQPGQSNTKKLFRCNKEQFYYSYFKSGWTGWWDCCLAARRW